MRAAMMCWVGFIRPVLLHGAEVMVWDTVTYRNKMEVIQRAALRAVLGLDRGANNELLYGEGENRVTADAEWMTLNYGYMIQGLGFLYYKLQRH